MPPSALRSYAILFAFLLNLCNDIVIELVDSGISFKLFVSQVRRVTGHGMLFLHVCVVQCGSKHASWYRQQVNRVQPHMFVFVSCAFCWSLQYQAVATQERNTLSRASYIATS